MQLAGPYPLNTEDGEARAVAELKAEHDTASSGCVHPDKFEGLQTRLFLTRGAKVMLRKNLWAAAGLANGSIRGIAAKNTSSGESKGSVIHLIGEVVDIVYKDQ